MKTSYRSALKNTFFTIFAVGIFYTATSFNALKRKECNSAELLSSGLDKLKNYSLIKNYPFSFKEKSKKKPIEFLNQIVTLNRGVKYKFLALNNPDFEGQPVVSIYNNEKQNLLYASTYNLKFKKFYDEINFECKTTGNYCLSFSFLDGKEGCAVGIMAFLE